MGKAGLSHKQSVQRLEVLSTRSVGSTRDKTLTTLSADGRGREILNQYPKSRLNKRMLIVAVAIVISVALSGAYFCGVLPIPRTMSEWGQSTLLCNHSQRYQRLQ